MTEIGDRLRSQYGDQVRIGTDCTLLPDLCVEIFGTGQLVIGDRANIRRGVTIQVFDGAIVSLGNDVNIGEHVFIAAMVAIRIGSGTGVSNMSDLHDHNHRAPERSVLPAGATVTSNASGFEGAPIVIENGVGISNKVTVLAGVRVGENAVLAANSVVSKSVPPNTTAGGIPAVPLRTFDGPLTNTEPRQELLVDWFGTSVMEHRESYSLALTKASELPQAGDTVRVDGTRNRGYPQRIELMLQAMWPHIAFRFTNHARGGATSRDLLEIVDRAIRPDDPALRDIAFFGCSVNDVWRKHQGRKSEAVDAEEFRANYRSVLSLLAERYRMVVCVGDVPLGWDDEVDLVSLNADVASYNVIAQDVTERAGATWVDTWWEFDRVSRHLRPRDDRQASALSLWSDGAHYSELGDTVVLQQVLGKLTHEDLERLTRYELLECSQARRVYGNLVEKW